MSALAGRHALITGGVSGIDAAVADALAAAGAQLSLLGLRPEPLQAAAARLGGTAVACDISNQSAIGPAFEKARAANGRLVSPEAVASLVLTLRLPQGRDTTGSARSIDGGSKA